MGLLKTLGNGQGYLKAGFFGFQKSGKTYTSIMLALGTRELFGLTGPIAMFDTEGGSEYVAKVVRDAGAELVGVKSRSFSDLLAVGQECVKDGVSVLIGDSVTHVWRELCDAWLKDINDKRRALAESRNWKFTPKASLEFQDWAQVKGIWSKWTDFYLNSPLHIIICGRAGFEYDMERNEDTGKSELRKTGTKMKVESEFGFEPSLLVEMEREQVPDGNGTVKLRRRATIVGDRFNVIDGKSTLDPTFDFFRPHVELLRPGAHNPIDTTVKTATGADEGGDAEWARERKTRTIVCEEIQAVLLERYPSTSAAEKKAKAALIREVFGTGSWTAVESMHSGDLRAGLERLQAILADESQLSQVVS